MQKASFYIGQLIQHRLFHYRGVIVDVDPAFCGSDEWYERVALTRPPRDKPWYRVLVHNTLHETYVAERNLLPEQAGEPVNHPLVGEYFERFDGERYSGRRETN